MDVKCKECVWFEDGFCLKEGKMKIREDLMGLYEGCWEFRERE